MSCSKATLNYFYPHSADDLYFNRCVTITFLYKYIWCKNMCTHDWTMWDKSPEGWIIELKWLLRSLMPLRNGIVGSFVLHMSCNFLDWLEVFLKYNFWGQCHISKILRYPYCANIKMAFAKKETYIMVWKYWNTEAETNSSQSCRHFQSCLLIWKYQNQNNAITL